MPKYVIERETPGLGEATVEELREASANSNQMIAELGPEISWLESFVTDDKMYCVFVALERGHHPRARPVRGHPRRSDLPGRSCGRSVLGGVDPVRRVASRRRRAPCSRNP